MIVKPRLWLRRTGTRASDSETDRLMKRHQLLSRSMITRAIQLRSEVTWMMLRSQSSSSLISRWALTPLNIRLQPLKLIQMLKHPKATSRLSLFLSTVEQGYSEALLLNSWRTRVETTRQLTKATSSGFNLHLLKLSLGRLSTVVLKFDQDSLLKIYYIR
jgi:hypothetical protein